MITKTNADKGIAVATRYRFNLSGNLLVVRPDFIFYTTPA